MTKLEEVARALSFRGMEPLDAMEAARAAIEALRNPTEEMVEAGFRAPERGMNMGQHAEAVWKAMIDSILSDGETVEGGIP